MTLQILLTCLASGGLFSFLQYLIQLFIDRKKKPTNETALLLAIAHDKIIYLCKQSIDRGYITQDEYDNVLQLYTPYRNAGGNHLAKKYFEEVDKLPIKD